MGFPLILEAKRNDSLLNYFGQAINPLHSDFPFMLRNLIYLKFKYWLHEDITWTKFSSQKSSMQKNTAW